MRPPIVGNVLCVIFFLFVGARCLDAQNTSKSPSLVGLMIPPDRRFDFGDEGTIRVRFRVDALGTEPMAILTHEDARTGHFDLLISGDADEVLFGHPGNLRAIPCSVGDRGVHTLDLVFWGQHSELNLDGQPLGFVPSGPGAGQNLPIFIGTRNGVANQFSGTIDEIEIWNHAFTEDELATPLGIVEEDRDEESTLLPEDLVLRLVLENGVPKQTYGVAPYRETPVYGIRENEKFKNFPEGTELAGIELSLTPDSSRIIGLEPILRVVESQAPWDELLPWQMRAILDAAALRSAIEEEQTWIRQTSIGKLTSGGMTYEQGWMDFLQIVPLMEQLNRPVDQIELARVRDSFDRYRMEENREAFEKLRFPQFISTRRLMASYVYTLETLDRMRSQRNSRMNNSVNRKIEFAPGEHLMSIAGTYVPDVDNPGISTLRILTSQETHSMDGVLTYQSIPFMASISDAEELAGWVTSTTSRGSPPIETGIHAIGLVKRPLTENPLKLQVARSTALTDLGVWVKAVQPPLVLDQVLAKNKNHVDRGVSVRDTGDDRTLPHGTYTSTEVIKLQLRANKDLVLSYDVVDPGQSDRTLVQQSTFRYRGNGRFVSDFNAMQLVLAENGRSFHFLGSEWVLAADDTQPTNDRNTWGGTFTLDQRAPLVDFNFRSYHIHRLNPRNFQEGTGTDRFVFAWPEDGSSSFVMTTGGVVHPQGLRYISHRQGLEDSHTTMISSMQKLHDAWNVNVGFNVGVEGLMSFGGNASYQQQHDRTNSSEHSHTLSRTYELRHTMVMRREEMELSSDFRAAIEQLRNEWLSTNRVDFHQFFESYGTHYPHAVTYGGMAYQEMSFDAKATDELTGAGYSISTHASATFDGLTAGGEIGGGHEWSQENQQRMEQQEQKVQTVGGEVSSNGGWSMPHRSEVPILLDLRGLDELLSPRYFDDPLIWNQLRSQMETALENYAREKPALPPDIRPRTGEPYVEYEVTLKRINNLKGKELQLSGSLQLYVASGNTRLYDAKGRGATLWKGQGTPLDVMEKLAVVGGSRTFRVRPDEVINFSVIGSVNDGEWDYNTPFEFPAIGAGLSVPQWDELSTHRFIRLTAKTESFGEGFNRGFTTFFENIWNGVSGNDQKSYATPTGDLIEIEMTVRRSSFDTRNGR